MRKLLVVAIMTSMLLTMFTSIGFAAGVTISGTVYSSAGGTVNYPPVKLYDITDTDITSAVANVTGTSSGTYSLTSPATNTSYFIRAQRAGYNSQLKVVDVASSNITAYDFTLDPVSSPIPVTGISVSPTSLSLNVGNTSTLTATFSPSNASNRSIAWTSDNKSVATVNSTTGLVTGVAAGTANITVTTADGGKFATCAVTVTGTNVPVTGVTVSPKTLSVGVSGNGTLTATVTPSNATNKSVTWSSDNTSIATVNSSGVVTGVARGTATITVTTVDGVKTAKCNVAVTGSSDMVINVDTSNKKSVQLKVGYNEYVYTNNPSHRFNDPTYVALMNDSGANLMRFPGGTIANFYNYLTDDFMTGVVQGVLDTVNSTGTPVYPQQPGETTTQYNSRVTAYRNMFATQADFDAQVISYKDYLQGYINNGNKCKLYRYNGVYGYNDFADLTSQMGADIYYVGNVSIAPSGTKPIDQLVQDQVVNWMQSLKNQGKTVKYLELGNELISDMDYANNQAIPNGLYDLNRYLGICSNISGRVKAIFPSIKIAIVSDAIGNKTGSGVLEVDSINRQIMSSGYGTSFFDAIVIHTYLRKYSGGDIVDLDEGRQRMFANSQLMTANSADYWRKIFPGKEIWMTEAGYVKGDNDIDFTATVLNAMLEADYILKWADNDDKAKSYIKFYSIAAKDNATAADGTKCVNFWNTNSIISKPTYYANQMIYKTLTGSSFRLGSSVLNNTFFSKTIPYYGLDASNNLQYYTNVAQSVENLDAKAYLSNDGTTITIPFVNKTASAITVLLNPTGDVPLTGKTGTMEYITGNLLDENTTTTPNLITPQTSTVSANAVISIPANSVGTIKISAQ